MLFQLPISRKTNNTMWNNTTAMTVERFTCLPPYNQSSPSPAAQPSFTLGWHMATFHKWMEITVKGQLPLCFAMFFSEMIILGILLVRTRNSEWLMWENDTLRNYTSNIIIQSSFGSRSQQYLQENYTCGNEGQRFHCIKKLHFFSLISSCNSKNHQFKSTELPLPYV